jgi:hypothetical protein
MEIMEKFHRYRQVFVDFRHHTDTIVGYIGRSTERIHHVFDVSEVNAALKVIHDVSGVQIPDLHNMRSQAQLEVGPEEKEREAQLVASFYEQETKLLTRLNK